MNKQWFLFFRSPRMSKVLVVSLVVLGVSLFAMGQDPKGNPKRHERSNRLIESGSNLDVFATGNCYFCLESKSKAFFVRGGRLVVLSHGELGLQTQDGSFSFMDRVTIPSDAQDFNVDYRGRVFARLEGNDSLLTVGEIGCFRFEAGRLLDFGPTNLGSSDSVPTSEEFGERFGAFILTGWMIEK